MIADGTVYAGLSKRTDKAAVQELREALPEMTVVPIPLKEDFLHLDCVFNMISETEALYCKNGLRQKEIDLLAERFEMIEVPEEEQFTLGEYPVTRQSDNYQPAAAPSYEPRAQKKRLYSH